MEIGDSVFFNNPKESVRFYQCCLQTFRGLKFTKRNLDNGSRIWRIK